MTRRRGPYPREVILGIDTALGTAVAVIDPDGVIVAEVENPDARGHAEVIGILLEHALAEARSTITAVAVGMGPGPFTGLRVGIAAARAFALGRGVPVLPVVSHDAAALAVLLADSVAGGGAADDAAAEQSPGVSPATVASSRFAVVTDARRREFAYSIYQGLDGDGLPMRLAGPELVARDELPAVLEEWGAAAHEVTTIPASTVALVAARTAAAGRPPASGDAVYLRAPDVTLSVGRKRVGT